MIYAKSYAKSETYAMTLLRYLLVEVSYGNLALLSNFGFSRVLHAVVALCYMKGVGAEELESGTAVHGPLQHLQPVDLARFKHSVNVGAYLGLTKAHQSGTMDV